MNILLIAPATGPWSRIARRRTFNGKTFRFSMLSMLSVAALSPKDAKVTIIDEQVEEIPDEDFDLVGITAMTALAPRAYQLCIRFRAKGIPVVMGGFHATLNTDEALEYADAVVVGPAYGAWERVCEDVKNGRLRRVYHGSAESGIPKHLPRHLMDKPHYVTASSTFATLGCRNQCQFCSISPFHKGQRYARSVDDVVEEVAAFSDDFFVFVDDNLTQDRDYALELFRRLAPLNKRWVTQTSLEIGQDPELLTAMRDGGCLGVFVGLETFDAAALDDQAKGFNKPAQYRDAVAAFHRQGMYVEAGVIVGFDADDVDVFRTTLTMLDKVGIDAIQLAVLTPLPGTPLFERMKNRIFDRDWGHYDYRHAVFEPRRMTAEELQAGADWLIRSFYSPWRILRRLPRWMGVRGGLKRFVYPLGLNLAYLGRVLRFRIRGCDPAARRTQTDACAIQNAQG
ncbi:MAG: B12-binding domain-containing radical SAM protein [bacterium]|nr:B12-binding domain-containing radical SAM protein [bacterium]